MDGTDADAGADPDPLTPSPLRPQLLKRYRDIALVLVKHWRSDWRRSDDSAAAPEHRDAASAKRDAERLATDLENLGPTFIKLGQVLSTRPDLLPQPYLDALSRLQDQVDPFPFAEVEKLFEAEVGVRMSKAFLEIDPVPMAAASLAQVHRAAMRDGRAVVVKVQRPELRRCVLEDLEALGEIAALAESHSEAARRLQLREMFAEFRRTMLRELDFTNEARNLVLLGESLAGFDAIVVPQPVEDFTTSRVVTMDYVDGRKVTEIPAIALPELDGAGLADELFRAYLKQILVDGFFHADPHPGNVLLTSDSRIALVDLGMVSRVSPDMQENLLKLMMAIADGRPDEAARVGLAIGRASEEFDEDGYRRAVVELVGDAHDARLESIEVGKTILQVTRIATWNGLQLPIELTLLGKTLLNLDQVAIALDPRFNPSQAIRHHAPELMRRRLTDEASPGRLFATVLEMREFVQQLPGRMNRILDAVAANDLRIKVHAIDETRFLAGLHKIANRITTGLVLSALIIGAALLMRVDSPYRIFGYPAIAMVCFSLAFVGGMLLLIAIWRDETPRR